MGLREYQRKRRFNVTPEPTGSRKRAASGDLYVIQKHDASRLHYDFRLELEGVLKSWAVPKGPSLDPQQRVLAVQVEDHPIEYGSFEGTIPEGQYGGGTVMLWDSGHWKAIGDAEKTYRDGRLKFELYGKKLRGIWNLVRMKPRGPGKSEWLLIKHGDEFARLASEYSITEAEPLSVASGRDLDGIASPESEVWQSGRASKIKSRSRLRATANRRIDPASIPLARKAPQPDFIPPQLATLTSKVPDGNEWVHEIKLDGYRIVCVLQEGRARLLSRRSNDWTVNFSEIAKAAQALPVRSAIIDGELVALNKSGVPDFQILQNALKSGSVAPLAYFAFDLLWCDGYDLRKAPLIERKKLLEGLIDSAQDKLRLRYNEHISGKGMQILEQACRMGLEGIVSKRADSPYISRRNPNWLKAKCKSGQEFVIGGFTDPSGARTAFGALLLGYYDSDGNLRYAGRVGTGFDQSRLSQLGAALRKMEIPKSAFADAPRERGTHWVRPELVAQVEFTQFTRDGRIRNSSFKGLRPDKPPKEVTLEVPGKNGDSRKASPSEAPATESRKSVVTSPKGEAVSGVPLSNPEKVLYPDEGITKRDLAEYYEAVGDLMLAHVAGRPLMIVRCPNGVGGKSFYQKHLNSTFPKALRGVEIKEKKDKELTLVLDDVKGLVSLAQMGVLEIHTWGCREDQVERPDRLIFDLDPAPEVSWLGIADAALLLRSFLRELKLESFVKLSGGKGVHVVVPVERRHSWDDAEAFTKAIATAFVTASPSKYVAVMSKAQRKGKIYIDFLRNQRGATCVAAYSIRARPGAAVSAPIDWDELKTVQSGAEFTLRDMARRIAKADDPWRDLPRIRQRIPSNLL